MELFGFLQAGLVSFGDDGRQTVLDAPVKGAVNIFAPPMGVDELAISADHAGDHGNRVFPALDLHRGQPQIEISLELISQDGEGHIGVQPDPLVDGLDFGGGMPRRDKTLRRCASLRRQMR